MSEQETPRGGRIGSIYWEPDPKWSGHYIVRCDGAPHSVGTSGSYSQIEERCRRDYRLHQEVQAAYASDDPTALCRVGWHQVSDGGAFFTFCNGVVNKMLHFRVGPKPGFWWSTHIAAIGPNAIPWNCSVCGTAFPSATDDSDANRIGKEGNLRDSS